jgi:hypothetical protein
LFKKAKPKHNPALAWRVLQDEVFILSSEDRSLHRLNSTGSFIWIHSIGEKTTTEIAQLLADHCEVALDVTLNDTEEFIANMLESDMLLLLSGESDVA